MSTCNVAVIGYGRMGIIHAENVLKLQAAGFCRFAGLVARNQEKAKEALARLVGNNGEHVVMSFEDMLSNVSIQAVIICSETSAHKDQIKSCCTKAKDNHIRFIFCEKPVALEAKDIDECYQVCEQHSVALMCAFNRRFDPSLKKLRDSIALGDHGAPHVVRIVSRDHPPPSGSSVLGGGNGLFFQDFSVHDIDFALWLAAAATPGKVRMPNRVFARATSVLPNYAAAGLDDTAVLILNFPVVDGQVDGVNGLTVLIENSRRSNYGYDVRVECLAQEAMLQVGNRPQTELVVSNAQGRRHDVNDYSFPERFKEAYEIEMRHFILDMCVAGRPCDVTRAQCVANMNVAGLAQESRLAQPKLPPSAATVRPSFKLPKEKLFSRANNGSVKFLLIGAGRMGLVHATTLKEVQGAELTYICDCIDAASEKCVVNFGCNRTGTFPRALPFAQLDEKLRTNEFSAVIITTISETHKDLILQCVKNGKHVFCEKPLALSFDDTKLCQEAAAANNVRLFCGFMRRFDPQFQQLYKAVQDREKFGQIEQIRITARDGASHNSADYLKAAGTYMYDSVIHDIDVARWLHFSNDGTPSARYEVPVEVRCTHSKFPLANGSADSAFVESIQLVLLFRNGTMCTIDNHRRAVYGYDQRVECHGAKQLVSCENVYQTTASTSNPSGHLADVTATGLNRFGQAYCGELQAFIRSLFEEEEEHACENYCFNTPLDCVIASQIADAATMSMEKFGMPILLSPPQQ